MGKMRRAVFAAKYNTNYNIFGEKRKHAVEIPSSTDKSILKGANASKFGVKSNQVPITTTR
jgi:hypothetical protein